MKLFSLAEPSIGFEDLLDNSSRSNIVHSAVPNDGMGSEVLPLYPRLPVENRLSELNVNNNHVHLKVIVFLKLFSIKAIFSLIFATILALNQNYTLKYHSYCLCFNLIGLLSCFIPSIK